jgi:hypothetical protein
MRIDFRGADGPPSRRPLNTMLHRLLILSNTDRVKVKPLSASATSSLAEIGHAFKNLPSM